MKTLFAFVLVLTAACTDDSTASQQQENVNQACTTSADCLPNYTCVHNNTTSNTPTNAAGVCLANTPVPSTCDPNNTTNTGGVCPLGERCNPICSTTGIAGYQCQPAGIPTQQCPVQCSNNTTNSGCSAGYYCVNTCPNNTTGTPQQICIPNGDLPPVCH